MMHNKIRNILLLGLFVALEVILTRFLSVENPIVRISFEFIPIALSAILFGPAMAGIGAAAADVLGIMIFPKGAFFPGFTFSAFVSGFLYGIFLYKKKITLLRIFAAVLAVTVTCSLILNTIWLLILTNNGAYAILTARLVKSAVFLPVQTFVIYFVWKYSGNIINGTINQKLE
jgi:ECF transporter S component (folate family)